ncbi:MAG: SurA N-terminal domain-containing protein [Actinomycetia bacterium]|nr:SurA N-terminal domain-containing protein [Actinomycetes bacterium]
METNDILNDSAAAPSEPAEPTVPTGSTESTESALPTRSSEKTKAPKQAKKRPLALIIGAGAVVVIALAALLILSFTGKVDVGIGHGGLAARVNGARITTKQLDALVAKVKLQNPQIFESNSGVSAGQIRSQLLDELINEELILQEAKKRGINVSDAQVQAQVDAIRKQYGSQKQFDAVLKEKQYTLEALKAQIKYQLVSQEITKKLVPDGSITTKQAQAYFDQNKKNFTVAAGKRVSQIKFALADSQKAADVLAQLKKGGDFGQLAQKNSIDAVSAANGGDFGWAPGNPPLDSTLQAAVNKLDKGEVSDVIRTSGGLFILKVTDTRAASQKTFADVENTIKATLLNSKRNKESQNLLASLRKKAKITVYDQVVKDFRAKKKQ